MSNPTAPTIAGFVDATFVADGVHGAVWRYRQLRPARDVAVKVYPADDGAASRRARHALRAHTALAGQPAVIDVYAAGTLADGATYLVLPWCRSSLAREPERGWTAATVADLGVRLAGALESAHRLGIVHLELTPGHVLLTAFDRPVVTGFGAVASVCPPEMARPWAAPERFGDEPTGGAASDCFSLGAILTSLLAHVDAPTSLRAALDRATDPDPLRRFGSLAEFAEALHHVQDELHQPRTDLELIGAIAPVTGDEVSAGPTGESHQVTQAAASTSGADLDLPVRRRLATTRVALLGALVAVVAAATWLTANAGPSSQGGPGDAADQPAPVTASPVGDLIPTAAPRDPPPTPAPTAGKRGEAPELPPELVALPMSGVSVTVPGDGQGAVVVGLDAPSMRIAYDASLPAPTDCRASAVGDDGGATVSWKLPGGRMGDVFLVWDADNATMTPALEYPVSGSGCLSVVAMRRTGPQQALVSSPCTNVCWGK